MSDYENHKGKIQKLNLDESKMSVEDFMKLKLDELKVAHDYWGSLNETFRDEFYEKYIILNEDIWEIYDHEEFDPDDSFCNLEQQDSGVDNFVFNSRFYNGGTCLTEMLEEALKIEQY